MKDIAIQVENASKTYRMWAYPRARLSGGIAERLARPWWIPGSLRRALFRFHRSVCRDFHALQNLSLVVQKGETFGIVGRNGSGKSTLLQLIAGVLQPTSGRVLVDGRVAALLELGAGFNPEFTGRENVFLNASVFGLTRRDIEAKFDEIADFADIGEFMEEPVKTYSSGMMMRLGFSVQTALDPDLLIIDEALSVGDETFQRKCFSRLERLREAGKTILFVSHDSGAVLNLCRRAIFLHRGELILEGPPKPVVNAYQRVAHAARDRVDDVLNQIRRDAVSGGMRAAGTAAAGEGSAQGSSGAQTEPAPQEDESFYDPELTSRSVVEYDSMGALIEHVAVLDDHDRQVNVLIRRQFYTFYYRVRFERECQNISFAMLLKTLKGQELGGYSTNTQAIPHVPAGQEYEVRFRFQCLLRPWVYYFNAGVEGPVEDKRAYAHRLVDAYVIRVREEKETTATGIVDFLIEPSVTVVKERGVPI